MKSILAMIVVCLCFVAGHSQKAISKSEFDSVFQNTVRTTNAQFPFVFTVVDDTYANGKLVSTGTEINERQAQGVERETKKIVKNGATLQSFGIMVGFGNNTYCSRDGKIWTGPQEYVCPGPEDGGLITISRPRVPESSEYSMTEEFLSGKKVMVYRQYSIFNSHETNGKKSFEETVARVDSRGFFIEITDTEGTLDPPVVTFKRKQSWTLNARFAPVVAPK